MKTKRKSITSSREAPMISIVGASEESVAATRGIIMDILNCEKSGDTAKVAALDTLTKLCKVENATISNCSFVAK